MLSINQKLHVDDILRVLLNNFIWREEKLLKTVKFPVTNTH